jgi:hypothetical protein
MIIRLLEWIWMSFIFIAILWKYDYKAAGMDMDEFYFLLLFDGSTIIRLLEWIWMSFIFLLLFDGSKL